MISKLEKQNKNKSWGKKGYALWVEVRIIWGRLYTRLSFLPDNIHDFFLGVWFGNTMRMTLCTYSTASEAGTRKQQAKVDVSLEKRASDRGDSAKWPWTEPAADGRECWTIMAWHGSVVYLYHCMQLCNTNTSYLRIAF
jgi:hypothetical protein